MPTIRKPYLTVALIVVNSVAFLFTYFQGARGFQMAVFTYGYIPDLFLEPSKYSMVPANLWLTPLTSMFMHGGWMHLIGNMVFLWIFGNNIEDYFGRVKFFIFYILSGIAATALYTLFNPGSEIPLVGASGAIAGVMGGYLVLHPKAEVTCLIVFFIIQFVVLPAKIVLGIWFALQIVMSLIGSSTGGGVAWLAHVGGFLIGFLILKAIVKVRGGGNVSSNDTQRVYRMHW